MNSATPTTRPLVVLVDDEDNIVLALHRVLYKDNDRYSVMLAKTGEIAQEILRNYRVDVLVTDVQLPGISGMDLLCWAAVESPRTKVIVMTAFDVAGIEERAHAYGCLQLTRKPFDVHKMRATINGVLSGHTLAGHLSELSLVDVIQMLCICRKTTTLRICEGRCSGLVVIEAGEVVHATWDDLSGEEAFFVMMGITTGLFNTCPPPGSYRRTIHDGWQGLLMEGMRRQDERARGDESGPAGPRPAAAVDDPSSHDSSAAMMDVDALIDRGFVALRAGEHGQALEHWQEGLRKDPNNRVLELNLKRLQAKLER